MPCQRACSSSFFPFWARSGPDSSHLQLQGPAQIGQAQQDGQALSVAVQPPMPQLGIAKDLLDPAKGELHIGPHPSLAPFRRVGGALPVHLEAAVRPDCHLPVQGKDPAARDAVRSPDSLHCRTPCTPGRAVDGGQLLEIMDKGRGGLQPLHETAFRIHADMYFHPARPPVALLGRVPL